MRGAALRLIREQEQRLAQQDPAVRIANLERAVADCRARIAALEVRQTPVPLKRRNAARQAEAERLREAIASTLAEHPQPDTLTAKGVLRALERVGVAPLPSERTVLRHLTAIRHGRTLCVE